MTQKDFAAFDFKPVEPYYTSEIAEEPLANNISANQVTDATTDFLFTVTDRFTSGDKFIGLNLYQRPGSEIVGSGRVSPGNNVIEVHMNQPLVPSQSETNVRVVAIYPDESDGPILMAFSVANFVNKN